MAGNDRPFIVFPAAKDLVEQELGNIDKLLEAVEPKDRLQFIIKLLPYTLPRYVSVEEEKPHEGVGWNEYVREAIKQGNKKYAAYIKNQQINQTEKVGATSH